MYTNKTQSTPWCPFCGYSENERSSHWPEKSVEKQPAIEEDKNTI
jgi:ribosomal protein L37E